MISFALGEAGVLTQVSRVWSLRVQGSDVVSGGWVQALNPHSGSGPSGVWNSPDLKHYSPDLKHYSPDLKHCTPEPAFKVPEPGPEPGPEPCPEPGPEPTLPPPSPPPRMTVQVLP